MALDAIEELSDEIDALRYETTQKLAQRDALIQDAKRAGIPYKTLGRRSRLSLNRLQAINAKPNTIAS